MRLVDTNVLLYAVNTSSPHHRASQAWLQAALSGAAPVGFAWLALVGFLRISTRPNVFPRPLSPDEAMTTIDAWLGAESAHVLHPGPRHASLLRRLVTETMPAGNLMNDAHLAALAIEHKATVITFDSDFTRFDGVRSERPT